MNIVENIVDVVQLASDYHESGDVTAINRLVTIYTVESVDEYLAEYRRMFDAWEVDDEGATIEQIDEFEKQVAVMAMLTLKAKAAS